jgi:CHRD domain
MNVLNYNLVILILVASVISVVYWVILPNTATGQEQSAFSAILSGKNEVMPTRPNSVGLATFQLNENASEISYSVNMSGIKKANQVALHIGTIGEEGEAVATLATSMSASEDNEPPMILITGNLTKSDLLGPLKDKQVPDLVSYMSNGTSYVNIYTDEYPEGEIRGQINLAEIGAGGGRSGSSKGTGDQAGPTGPGIEAPEPGIDPSGGRD